MGQERLQRVAEEIKRQVGQIIRDELNDPRIGFITVTRVDLSRDCRLAKIYFSLLGTKKQLRDTEVGLKRSQGFIRKLLSQRMRLRYTPEVIFRLDANIEYGIHIAEVLRKIEEDNGMERSTKDN